MNNIVSKSDKRLIVDCKVEGKSAPFLIDTGASIALIDSNQVRKYKVNIGNRFKGTIIGAGGELTNTKYCNSLVYIKDKPMGQFIIADIENIVDSIERETNIKILGIIGLDQMKMAGIQIDANDNLIIIETT